MQKLFKNKALFISFIITAIIISAIILFMISNLILLISISILIALIFNPVINFLESRGINRLISTLGVFLIIGITLYIGLSVLIPQFAVQMNQLILTLHVKTLHQQIYSVERKLYNYIPYFTMGQLTKKVDEFISSEIVSSVDKISVLLSNLVSLVELLVIVPFITFFLLKDNKTLVKGILHIVPNKYFEMTYWIIKKIAIQLGRFVRGWIFDATFVGTTCGFGYYIIGVHNSFPLGVISGLGHLVPYFGPIIGGVPAIAFSIIQNGNLSQVPLIILMIVIIYLLDNGIVQPLVFSKSVDMHPVVIIILIIAGSQLSGIFGMLFAVPLATVIRTASKEMYFAYKNYKIAKL